MKRVITYGTFDLLHYGHINLLRRAKELGDYLIVVVSSDEFNWNEKGKKCYFTPNEHSGLISFRMDRLDLLAVQGTLKSLLQHHSSKASILCCSAFFIVQLLHTYMTTGKTKALTRQTFAGKLMFLLFNILSWLVITFLSRSRRLLILCLQSPSTVILKPPK